MSWFSEATGIHISAPAIVQQIGDKLGGLVANAVPFGGGAIVNGILGLTGTNNTSVTAGQIAAATAGNLQAQASAGYGAAAQVGYAQQNQGALGNLIGNPLVLAALVLVVYLLARRR